MIEQDHPGNSLAFRGVFGEMHPNKNWSKFATASKG